ncbi:MAG: hypothetical protein RIQ83_2162 [Pseudomonadota bacterium]|jgi:hypothetical protein
MENEGHDLGTEGEPHQQPALAPPAGLVILQHAHQTMEGLSLLSLTQRLAKPTICPQRRTSAAGLRLR